MCRELFRSSVAITSRAGGAGPRTGLAEPVPAWWESPQALCPRSPGRGRLPAGWWGAEE